MTRVAEGARLCQVSGSRSYPDTVIYRRRHSRASLIRATTQTHLIPDRLISFRHFRLLAAADRLGKRGPEEIFLQRYAATPYDLSPTPTVQTRRISGLVAPTGIEPAPRGVGIRCRLFVFIRTEPLPPCSPCATTPAGSTEYAHVRARSRQNCRQVVPRMVYL